MMKFILAALTLTAGAAQADLAVRFDEGAPKDRFSLTNTGDCALPAFSVLFDIGAAPAGLIFDVTGSGAGVEVFQPLVMVAGQELLRDTPMVKDGDSAIMFDLDGLGVGAQLAFTIDVDDTGGGREITVNGAEIQGASVTVTFGETALTGVFDDTARAVIATAPCTS